MKNNHHSPRRLTAFLLVVAVMLSLIPSAFAAQQNSYHDPAEHWQEALNRTNELDANSVVTRETFNCCVCDKATAFEVFRVPEYTRNGETALTRNVKYSDGTCLDGESKGDLLDGTPGQDATYTGYHWTKAVCEVCGTINSNMGATSYACNKNVYWLYDCAADFFEELPETQTVEQADSTYHRIITTSGGYCAFCYGTYKEESSTLERHHMETVIRPELAHDRFVEMDTCADCGYAETAYTAAKSVVADYFGVVDGQPHTVTVSDLSETGVTTAIRYGHSADACTLTSAPNYTEAGDYAVYYEITYTYENTDMVEDGVAYVHLRDESTEETDGDGTCGEDHNWTLLDSVNPTCLTLGYDRYLCVDCGKIEKRDYEAALGHAFQSVVIRDATCETPGKVLEICERCGTVQESTTPKGEHEFSTTVVPATCTSPGYTLRECYVCGERHIEDITAALPHNYVAKVSPATCEGGGKTVHICEGCGSSFVTDYTAPLGHSWDEGTEVTGSTCTGEGVIEYRCVRCGYHRLEGDAAAGHVPGEAATCTTPQLCTKCGAVIVNALGHDYQEEITTPTCTEMGYISFEVPAGKTVALVGASGSGKSTAASLIPRFYDVQSGSVTIGGVDVRNIEKQELMERVAFVFQNTRLFKDTLLNNIKAARPDATREEVLKAADEAQCKDIIDRLPDGLDTLVGTGGTYLSGGENQRIALARAILKDAPIIVLDEATAFADAENEHQIQLAFERLTQNKTVLMIAHRLSTIQDADLILVFKDGQIAERGTHEELVALNGIYSSMWKDYQTSIAWKVGKEDEQHD